MKKRRFLLSLVMGSFTVIGIAGEAPKIDWTLDVPVYGKYVARGAITSNKPVFQPTLSGTWDGWTMALFANYQSAGATKGRFDETGLFLWKEAEFEGGTWLAGAVMQDFPNTGADSTAEVFASVTLDEKFSPTVSLYRDVDEIKGTYIEFRGSHPVAVTRIKNLPTLESGLDFWSGWGDGPHNSAYYANGTAGFADWGVSYKVSTCEGPGCWYASGTLTGLWNKNHLAGRPDRTNFIWGAGYSVSF